MELSVAEICVVVWLSHLQNLPGRGFYLKGALQMKTVMAVWDT
jgi:hypothetical protein